MDGNIVWRHFCFYFWHTKKPSSSFKQISTVFCVHCSRFAATNRQKSRDTLNVSQNQKPGKFDSFFALHSRTQGMSFHYFLIIALCPTKRENDDDDDEKRVTLRQLARASIVREITPKIYNYQIYYVPATSDVAQLLHTKSTYVQAVFGARAGQTITSYDRVQAFQSSRAFSIVNTHKKYIIIMRTRNNVELFRFGLGLAYRVLCRFLSFLVYFAGSL